METFLNLLRLNDTLVYFAYGQVFFCLGLAIALHSRRHSHLDLARQLSWLAAFGLSHGLYEWAHVFIPIQAAYLPSHAIALLNAGRIALLALSFFFLGQFGALVGLPDSRLRRGANLYFGAALLVWLAWSVALAGGAEAPAFVQAEAWARRAVGFPSSALAAMGMFRGARNVAGAGLRTIARDFQIAALSFGAYAYVAGLVPIPDPLAAQWPIYGLKVEFLFLPAPVIRSLAGLGVAFGIIRGLRIFDIETDRRLEEAERARLQASERARGAMEAMATTISQHRDLARLADAALGQFIALAGSAAGCLMLAGRGSGQLQLQAHRGLPAVPALGMGCVPKEGCACLTVAAQGQAGVSSEGGECCRWSSDFPRAIWAAIPLVAHGRVLGLVHLVEGDFGPEVLALLVSLGKQLGLAVENAELEQEVARKEVARAQLLRKVITAQEEERRRVARELHDQTGQSLTAVIMALGAARERMDNSPRRVVTMLDEAREVAVRALDGTRELIMGLRPASLDDLGLVPTLRRFAEDLTRKGRLEIVLETRGTVRRVPGDVEIVLFRILQESLHNVLRHSQARRATVQLATVDGEMRAEVTDDGLGFDLAEAMARPESGRGLGLLGMKERAGLLGGKVKVETAPGRGTRVLVMIPLPEPEEDGRNARTDS